MKILLSIAFLLATICTVSCKKDKTPSAETVTDVEGNEYKTVKIGEQVWMAENLKTLKLNDETSIPLVSSDATWSDPNQNTVPMACFYENNEEKLNTYGVLYNWYAVNSGKLAPKGWHIPTDEEWQELIAFLGGVGLAGGKLKETGIEHWNDPNFGATNEIGFTAFGAGWRNGNDGLFQALKEDTYYWSSSTYPTSFRLSSTYNSTKKTSETRDNGNSIRCIKD